MAQGQPVATSPTSVSTGAAPGLMEGVRRRRAPGPRRLLAPLLFVGPAIILIGIFIVYPTVKTIYLSFYSEVGIGYNAPLQFVGFDNYAFLGQDDSIHTAIVNNILWLVLVTPVTVVLGVIFAVLFDRVKYEAIPKAIVFIPMAVSATAAGVIWKLMYAANSSTGTINAVLSGIFPGFSPISWLGRTDLVNFMIMGAYIWTGLGFAVVILSAALKSIPGDLKEAAGIDGANELQIFRYVTLPLMWPTITVIITLTMIGVLKIFDLVYTMTGGGPAGASDVLGTRMYIETFKNANQGYGSTIAVLLLIAVIPIMAINIRRFQSEGPR